MCCKNKVGEKRVTPDLPASIIPLEHLCCMAKLLYKMTAAARARFQSFEDPVWESLSENERLAVTEKVRLALDDDLTPESDFDSVLNQFAGIFASGR